jgi:hypothetical protein
VYFDTISEQTDCKGKATKAATDNCYRKSLMVSESSLGRSVSGRHFVLIKSRSGYLNIQLCFRKATFGIIEYVPRIIVDQLAGHETNAS